MKRQTTAESGQVKFLDDELRSGTIKPDDGGTDVFFTEGVIEPPLQWGQLYRGRAVQFQRRPQTRIASRVLPG